MLEKLLRILYKPVWKLYWATPCGSLSERLVNKVLDCLDWVRDNILFR